MAVTKSEQTRTAIKLLGKDYYEIFLRISDPGDLPTDHILVREIVDVSDPKDDTFARVATVSDLVNLVTDRPTAIDNGDEYFRVVNHTFRYTSIDTADAAQDTIKARIDTLVKNWQTYDRSFEATSEETEHPRPQQATIDELVSDYCDAKDDENDASDTLEEKKEAYEDAQSDATEAASDLTAAETRYSEIQDCKAYFDALQAAVISFHVQANAFAGTGTGAGLFITQAKTFKTAANALRNASCVTGSCGTGVTDPYDTAESTFTSQIGSMETTLATQQADVKVFEAAKNQAAIDEFAFAAIVSQRNQDVVDAQTAKTTADTAVQTALTEYKDAQTAYDKAVEKTESIVAAIRALDPDWDPSDANCNAST